MHCTRKGHLLTVLPFKLQSYMEKEISKVGTNVNSIPFLFRYKSIGNIRRGQISETLAEIMQSLITVIVLQIQTYCYERISLNSK